MDQKMISRWADVAAEDSSPLDRAVHQRDRTILQMVDAALTHRETALAFQPVVEAAQMDRAAFYEGLIRIFDPSGRIIPARDFMPTVEAQELGRKIDCVALEAGLAVLAATPHIRISLNMSARSVGYHRWVQILTRGLARDPGLADRLILEISEKSVMLLPELVGAFITELRQQRVTFALDDFGAGYLSLDHVQHCGFDIVKISGKHCKGVAQNPAQQAMVRALSGAAQEFGCLTVAEAVETPQDAAWLARSGVSCLQGYAFGAPRLRPSWAVRSPQDGG